MSRRVFFVVLFVICFFLTVYLQSNAYGAINRPDIWDMVTVSVPLILGFEGIVLVYWAWVDDDRLYELERKTQDIVIEPEPKPEEE
jgi:uncharacterized membrane protein YhdT